MKLNILHLTIVKMHVRDVSIKRDGAHSGVNFINILRTNFSYECHFGSFFYVHVTRKKLPKQSLNKKFVRKRLMKLTLVRTFISEKVFLLMF
jgi:hypothetical protein